MKEVVVFSEVCSTQIPRDSCKFISFFQDKLDLVPIEFSESAKIDLLYIPRYDDIPPIWIPVIDLQVVVSCSRPFTDEELLYESIEEKEVCVKRTTILEKLAIFLKAGNKSE
jgi:hypothetical protein